MTRPPIEPGVLCRHYGHELDGPKKAIGQMWTLIHGTCNVYRIQCTRCNHYFDVDEDGEEVEMRD